MKGAKGGNRDRIISWLFSEKNRRKNEDELEIEKSEKIKSSEKEKKRQEDVQPKENNTVEISTSNILPQEENINYTTPLSFDESEVTENNELEKPLEQSNLEIFEETIGQEEVKSPERIIAQGGLEVSERTAESIESTVEITADDDKQKKPTKTVDVDINDVPTLFIDAEIVEEIKDYNKGTDRDNSNTVKESEENELVEQSSNNFFPEVNEISIHDEEKVSNVEGPELIKVSIIEEIEKLIKDDAYDLKDIKYKIEVLNQLEKDEVLLENVEKIQKELELLIKRFEEIKKKYDFIYSYISISDLELVSDFDIDYIITNYISDSKAGIDSSNTVNQIKEIEEFIEIINGIIDIEKQKDLVMDSVEHKLVDFNIRDDEFIKLQDQYANIENINDSISNYNSGIDKILTDIENKIANSIDISKHLETTISIVPDVNRIIGATVLMASTKMIPPTPAGSLFKATLFASAVHMMATALTPKEETKEIKKITVNDYSRDILNSKRDLKDILNNINYAFSEIAYMKDLFEKEFSQYRSQIPEYDILIKNIFAIETELSRQQSIVYDYDNKFEQALSLNNQKVKVLENE